MPSSADTFRTQIAFMSDAERAAGTILGDFRATTDGSLFLLDDERGSYLHAYLSGGYLVYETQELGRTARLEAEDTHGLLDDQWHSFAITVSSTGTTLSIDGYPSFWGTTTAFVQAAGRRPHIQVGEGGNPELRNLTVLPEVLGSRDILSRAVVPEPLVEFAANYLAPQDVERVAQLRHATVNMRFRMRGRGQGGALLALAAGGEEKLSLRLDATGLRYILQEGGGRRREIDVPGSWDEGDWHYLALVVGRGAVDVFVDGNREIHAPGEFFAADVPGLDEVFLGRDAAGIRIGGEVQRAAIYPRALNVEQIHRLHAVTPIETVAVMDRGYRGSASYRIPSLLCLGSGTLLVGADQRVSIPNDAPNRINFVMRRSLDGGRSWEELQTVIERRGEGLEGACVIDSCMVQDPATGRVHVLIDYFPGGIGQPKALPGTGFDEQGRRLLVNEAGELFAVEVDGRVVEADGGPTGVVMDESLGLWENGEPAGHLDLAPGAHPRQRFFAYPTSHLLHVFSDDEGLTWSEPRDLNLELKQPWMRFLGTGPGTGIVLRHGEHAGRIVMPVYFNNEANWLAMSAAVVYSDDHGKTWALSASPNTGRPTAEGALEPATFTDETYSLYESTVVERADGTLLIFMRNQDPSGRVARAESHDGGQTWSAPEFDQALPEIWCQPNAISLRRQSCARSRESLRTKAAEIVADGDQQSQTEEEPVEDLVLFANASLMLPFRGSGTLRLSRDGGRNWVSSKTFQPGHYVYQSMCELPDGDVGLLWENECQGLYFSRIPLSYFD